MTTTAQPTLKDLYARFFAARAEADRAAKDAVAARQRANRLRRETQSLWRRIEDRQRRGETIP